MIAVIVLTHDRVHLLRQCVENVLARTSELTTEIIIWDNASQDGTSDYLATLHDPRFRIVAGQRNIGQNAYAEAFALLLPPKPSEAQARQTRERNTCLRYYQFLMYEEPRSVPVPYVRRPLGIGPGLCELPRTP